MLGNKNTATRRLTGDSESFGREKQTADDAGGAEEACAEQRAQSRLVQRRDKGPVHHGLVVVRGKQRVKLRRRSIDTKARERM